jgi:hypothetical protein
MREGDDILWPIRTDVGTFAGVVAALALAFVFGFPLGATPIALAIRGILHLAAAVGAIVLWSRLEEPGTTLRWTLGAFIAVSTCIGVACLWQMLRG